jgi:hypothetical protein
MSGSSGRPITVKVPESVWSAVYAYEPYRDDTTAALAPDTRRKLGSATRSTGWRMISFTSAEADHLETWLRSVIDRADAPREIADALATLRHERRLAE